jgi:hypothetical protein
MLKIYFLMKETNNIKVPLSGASTRDTTTAFRFENGVETISTWLRDPDVEMKQVSHSSIGERKKCSTAGLPDFFLKQ